MQNTKKDLLLGMLIFMVVGCSSAPVYSQKALKIQVHTRASSLLDKCTNLGPISATAQDKMMGKLWAEGAAENAAREKVDSLGGDTFLILNVDHIDRLTSAIQGVAFKCY